MSRMQRLEYHKRMLPLAKSKYPWISIAICVGFPLASIALPIALGLLFDVAWLFLVGFLLSPAAFALSLPLLRTAAARIGEAEIERLIVLAEERPYRVIGMDDYDKGILGRIELCIWFRGSRPESDELRAVLASTGSRLRVEVLEPPSEPISKRFDPSSIATRADCPDRDQGFWIAITYLSLSDIGVLMSLRDWFPDWFEDTAEPLARLHAVHPIGAMLLKWDGG